MHEGRRIYSYPPASGPLQTAAARRRMDAAPTAGPSSSPPRQVSSPIALSKRTTSKNAIRDTFQDVQLSGSPPTTPPPNRRRKKERVKGKAPLRPHASADDYDSHRHSHGLSWHSTTRDSVVDNLLFSLDNLSRPNLSDEDDGMDDLEFDKAKYMFNFIPNLPMPPEKPAQRMRSHTHSSSLSSGYGRRIMDSPSSYSAFTPKGRRSNSTSNFGIGAQIADKTKGTRASVTRVSSETQKSKVNGNHGNNNTSKADGSYRESNDYGHSTIVSTTRLGWGRRSMSMDQIYADSLSHSNSILARGRPVPGGHHRFESAEVAPEPMIPAGPRKKENPTARGPVYVNQAAPKANLRNINTQADLRAAGMPVPSPPIPQDIRNQASDFVRINSSRGVPATAHDSTKAQSRPSMQSTTFKTTMTAQQQRPGFFKRVFGGGSSRGNSVISDRTNSADDKDVSAERARTSSSNASQSRSGTRQSSRDQPTSNSYPPVSLNKKPSSLFRRRKKSTLETEPPPPLPVGLNNLRVKPGEPSPSVSSLRKVMDPFLSEDPPLPNGVSASKLGTQSRPTTEESSTEGSDNLDIFHSGYTPPIGASLGQRDPLSRSPSVKPKQSVEQQDSPHSKMKVKKRRPDALSPTSTQFSVNKGGELLNGRPISSAKVSPITVEVPVDDKENQRPVSHASTGDRIIAASISIESGQGEREPSVISNVSSERPEDQWVRPSTDRPDSKKSERLFLKPTASEELLPFQTNDLATVLEASNDGSARTSARSPAFQTATSAAFPPGVHSPVTPSTQYHSASSLPLRNVQVDGNELRTSLEANGTNLPSAMVDEGAEYRERARKIFEGDEEDVTKAEAASWLGEKNTLSTRTLQAFMELFDFTGMNILSALRTLCGKLVLKGETQQFDRIVMALSARWCECNPNHGFKAQDVVHTLCYSLILLNTDLHLADIGEKMSRSAYVKNTLPTIRRVVADAAPNAFDDISKPPPNHSRPTMPWSDSGNSLPIQSPDRTSFDHERPAANKRLSIRPPFDRSASDGNSPDSASGAATNALVNQTWSGPLRTWEFEMENILKSFYAAIRVEPLPLLGAPISEPPPSDRNLSVANLGGALKRSNSVVSKAQSDAMSFRGFKNMTMGFQTKYNRSRPRVYPSSTMGSTRTSLDGDSVWSPVQSSNWSKYSFSKTLTSASMQSLGQQPFSPTASDFKHSIGFANALSQAIIREENAFGQTLTDNESMAMSVPRGMLEDEDLALEGAPWAKEGMVKHKHHLENPGKKAKERSWSDVFAVMGKGKLTLFAFNTSSKSMSMGRKALTKPQGNGRAASATVQRVGGGDWMENAEQLDVFVLRQTIASTLPSPGYSKTRPYVWALSLPSGAVHLFQVGTPEIAQEFMTTANYWSARLSKEPLSGGVSNIEYGWSDQVVNTALLDRSGTMSPLPTSAPNRPSHMHSNSGGGMPRPSFQSSIRTSLDTGFGTRARLPGDKVQLAEWHPPSQSMMASQLMEVDQLKALTAYVSNVESELASHNELKQGIELAYSPRHANYSRAMANWQRKSDYLLREIVKFQTYVDSLTGAQKAKDAYYARKNQHESTKTDGAEGMKEEGVTA